MLNPAIRFFSIERPVPNTTVLWRIYWAAGLAFVPTLFLQYVGEEANTVIVTQEMWANQDFINTTLYGWDYGRPGLYSWLMLVPVQLLQWDHILVAARIITVLSTLLTGLLLAWLVRRIFKDSIAAAFAAAVYLSGDVLLYRGWLAYVDPLFSLLVFASMSCLWVAVAERRNDFLLLAVLALIGTFLAKTLTGYSFYAVFALVLLWRHENRGFLFRPVSLALHAAVIAFPIAWIEIVARSAIFSVFFAQSMLHLNDVRALDFAQHARHFLLYPPRLIWNLLPASAIALYCFARGKFEIAQLRQSPIDIVVWALLLNTLPYWLAPSGGSRYLAPLYPLFALLMSFIVLRSGGVLAEITLKALMVTIGIAYVATIVGFPLYEHYVRGSYADAARAILVRIGNHPIYALDDSSVSTSIVANLNVMRAPIPPVTLPPAQWSSGFVLVSVPHPSIGRVAETVRVGHRTRYLVCRGDACDR